MIKTLKSLNLCILAIGLSAPIAGYAGITFTNIFSFNGTNGTLPGFLAQAGNNKFFGITEAGGPNFTGPSSNWGIGSVYSITFDGVFSNVFFFDGTNGNNPHNLTPGSDGNFYGLTGDTVFKLNPDGTMAGPDLAPEFDGLTSLLLVGLVQDHDGTLYGTAGSLFSSGTVYKIDTNGVFSTLVTFNGTNGADPGRLILGADNNFYGVTQSGGNGVSSSNPHSGDGILYRMDRSGNLTNIFLFSDPNGQPDWLIQGADGDLYGATAFGGTNGAGSLFRITTNGVLVWSFSFNGTNGYAGAAIIAANDGNFYGAASGGLNYNGTPTSGYGTIFRITPGGSFTTLVQFDGTNDNGVGGIVQGTDGNLYGTSSGGGTYGLGAIFKLTLPACPATNRLMLTTVYSFYDNPSFDFPEDGLIQASDGMLYGITQDGGTFGGGSIFRTTLSGSLATLLSFNGTNGDRPIAPPVQAADGNFYGTTGGGGSANYGTIYRMDSNGVLATLFNFNGTNGAGAGGVCGLIVGNDGAFYGVTQAGGPNLTNINGGDGTIFKITTNGDFTSLASFNGTNGSQPVSIIQASDGNFYGATLTGGISDTAGAGTVFQMTPGGQINTLVRFNGTNGEGPFGIIQASDGCLYGTTVQGGASYTGAYPNFGNGTVFKITTNGDFTLLASFTATNGASPRGGLIEVCNGLFYGTAYSGGLYADPSGPSPAFGGGTVFQVTTNGDLTALALFGVNSLMPANPLGRLLKASDGNYYGTSQSGGTTNGSPIESVGGIFAIRPVQAPVLQPLAQPGQLNLSWNAWVGYSYAVIYETNLTGSNWNLLSTVTPQTNGPTSFSDPIGSDAQRFYSVILQLP